VRCRGLHTKKDAGLVDRDCPFPFSESCFLDRLDVAQAGIVDEDVQCAELFDCLGARDVPFALIRDVVLDERGAAPRFDELSNGRLTRIDLDVGDKHRGAFLHEALHGRLPDPTGRAGDKCHPSV